MVTEQKNYENGQLVSVSKFDYDQKGRPLRVEYEEFDYRHEICEMTYDQYGTLVQQTNASGVGSLEPSVYATTTYTPTYTDGVLTSCLITYDNACGAYEMQYDSEGRLTAVIAADNPENTSSLYWQAFSYDEYGCMISCTTCYRYPQYEYNEKTYHYSIYQFCYSYNALGQLTDTWRCGISSKEDVRPEDVPAMELNDSPDSHYVFHYDDQGRLAYSSNRDLDAYAGGSASIYRDENYQFDANGNLISVVRGPRRTEYTYAALEPTRAEAITAKHLMRYSASQYRMLIDGITADPLFYAMVPQELYPLREGNDFSYLAPSPLMDILEPVPVEREPVDLTAMKPISVLVEEIQYGAHGSGSLIQRNTYDENGIMLQHMEIEFGKAIPWKTEVDAYGRLVAMIRDADDYDARWEYTYDAVGNLLTETFFTTGTEPSQKITYTYDAAGNLVSREEMHRVSGVPQIRSYTYIYENGLLIREEEYYKGELADVVEYTYDDRGRLLTAKKYYNEHVRYEYTYVYSEDGLMRTRTDKRDKKGRVTEEYFDEYGNLICSKRGESSNEYIYRTIWVPIDWPVKNG